MKFKVEFENFEKLRKCSCVALTGNGSSEVGLLEVITKKLDGTSNLLCFPHYPSKLGISEEMRKKLEPRTTLAILKVLANYVEASIHGPFLVIIDLEHFNTDIAKEVKNQAESERIGLGIKGIKRINSSDDKALLINCQNEKIFTIVMCAMGDKICPKTEIHIAKVIEYKYGVWIRNFSEFEKLSEIIKQHYNECRPHQSFDNKTPAEVRIAATGNNQEYSHPRELEKWDAFYRSIRG